MDLILAEKPSVAKDIAKAIGNVSSKDGYVEVGNYIISWAFGHLVEIDDSIAPEKWEEATLPIFPEKFSYKASEGKSKQLNIIKSLTSKADRIIIATDPGREGELIARLILNYVGWKKWDNVYRLWTSEALTTEVVRRELKNLKPSKDFDSLYQCALARSHSDWIVGINLTRLITLKANKGLWSVGRVQTPVLAIIVDRDLEIENFKPVPYGVVEALFDKDGKVYKGTLVIKKDSIKEAEKEEDEENKDNDDAFRLTPEQAKNIVDKLQKETKGIVVKVQKQKKSEPPPLLHSLTSLQREANRLYGLSASKTLEIAQELYEKKYISYPRTDAQHLADSSKDLVKSILSDLGHSDLVEKVDRVGKRVFDDSKLTDHYALIPMKDGKDLEGNLQKIYNLIYRKFIGAFMDNYEYEITKVITKLGEYDFYSSGKVDLSLGWKSLYKQEDKETEETLPPLNENDSVIKKGIQALTKYTKPPARYTEATILKVMEKYNLGTPATRASIIETLKHREYIKEDKKSLISTQKGRELIFKLKEVGSSLIKIDTTSKWEEELENIYKKKLGIKGYNDFLASIKDMVKKEIDMIKNKTFESKRDVIGQCPVCKEGEIEEFPKLYKCNKCGVIVWRETFGKKIDRKTALDLLSGEPVLVKGLKSKAGKLFNAKLKYQDGKVSIAEFVNNNVPYEKNAPKPSAKSSKK